MHATTIQANLCNPDRDVNGSHFTCGDKADNEKTFACTGSEHQASGQALVCTCECHARLPQTLTAGVSWTVPVACIMPSGE